MRKELNEKAYSLIGVDGNAFAVMGYVSKAMRECGHPKQEIDAYMADAQSADYNNLLCVSMDMIEMLNQEQGYKEGHQFTKPEDTWEDEEPEDFDEEYESLSYPKWDDVKLNEDEEYDVDDVRLDIEPNILHVKHLLPLDKDDKCLYLTPNAMAKLHIDKDELEAFLGMKFQVADCDGCIECIISRHDEYEFNLGIREELMDKFGLSPRDIKPYVYTYDEMQPIINDSFRKRFGDRFGRA